MIDRLQTLVWFVVALAVVVIAVLIVVGFLAGIGRAMAAGSDADTPAEDVEPFRVDSRLILAAAALVLCAVLAVLFGDRVP